MKAIIATLLLFISLLSVTAFAEPDVDALELEGARVWQMLPRPSEMIRYPGADGLAHYGLTKEPQIVSVDRLPGGEALEVVVSRKGTNIYSAGIQAKNQIKISKGDVIFTAIWIRATELPEGLSETTTPIALQEAKEPYDTWAIEQAKVGQEWRLHFVYGTAPEKYKKEGMTLSLQIAGEKQTLEVGPVYMMNMGQGEVDPSAMPRNVVR
ncbi:hypothetical protein [Litorimonas sp.]|uniref:hypothetical protein n=1 Tax=Litorimonas sp. TaxID=1892381 RepID=UPI003A85F6FE